MERTLAPDLPGVRLKPGHYVKITATETPEARSSFQLVVCLCVSVPLWHVWVRVLGQHAMTSISTFTVARQPCDLAVARAGGGVTKALVGRVHR